MAEMDREKVIKAVETCFDSWIDKHRNMWLDLQTVEQMKRDALELLKDQDAVMPEREGAGVIKSGELVPVVRCKDCVECYYALNRVPNERAYVCGKHGIDVEQDFYCADGKRKVVKRDG